MAKPIPPSTREINRLRAAAALIPIIESGLASSRFSIERAALMATFCEWTTERPAEHPEAVRLATSVGAGVARLKIALSGLA